MSFNFEWPTFSDDFYADAKEMLAAALNKGETPPIIADKIEVKELNMGTIPPELEILEIGDLSTDRFRGIFRLTYAGDAYIVLQTKVQANPLNVPRPSLDILGAPRILFAAAPLVVPMTLRLSSLSLRAIVVLVVSRQKGITLVFKNDPLESVNVSSSFDGVDSVAGFIQKEIEAQLREAFRSDLPSVIHRLSQKWLSGEVKTASEETAAAMPRRSSITKGFDKDAKIQTRTAYVDADGQRKGQGRRLTTRMSTMSLGAESMSIGSDVDTAYSTMGVETRPLKRSTSSKRSSTFGSPTKNRTIGSVAASMLPKPEPQTVPESIESYDPTYGLRPDSIPLHAGFGEYQRLVQSGSTRRGLGDVLEGDDENEGMEKVDEMLENSYGLGSNGLPDLAEDLDQVDLVGNGPIAANEVKARRRLSYQSVGRGALSESLSPAEASFETIPAVGGGTITRPRILHTQSQMRTRAVSNSSLSAHGSPSTTTAPMPDSAASTIGDLLDNAAFRPNQDDRRDWIAGRSYAGSGTSTPRFPFPKVNPRAPSFASAPALSRQHSAFSVAAGRARAPHQRHRSNLSQLSLLSVSPDKGRAGFASTGPKAPSVAEPESPEADVFPPARPDPIDLLSRSPSSVLNNSYDEDLGIVVNPSASDSCAHLATLTHSNQTLSPFTRSHEHFTARSSPHILNGAGTVGSGPMTHLSSPRLGTAAGAVPGASISSAGGGGGGEPIKAKRKRIHRIGSASSSAGGRASLPASSDAGLGRGSSPIMASSSQFGGHGSVSRDRSPYRHALLGNAARVSSSVGAPRVKVGPGPGAGTAGHGVHARSSSLGSMSTSATGLGRSSRAPSELSDYFPNTAYLMDRMRRRMERG